MNKAGRNKAKEKLLENIIKEFQRITPIRLHRERAEATGERGTDDRGECDLLHLNLPDGRRIGPLAITLRPQLDRAGIAQLAVERGGKHPTVVAAQHINPDLAEALVKRNLPFLDAAGNAYLNIENVFILITGRRLRDATGTTTRPPTRAFRTAGLKLILAFLQDKDLINQTYREIAAQTDIAIGTITNVLNDLEQLGYLQKTGNKRRLLRLDDLATKWAGAYIEKMRDKVVLGRFRTTARDPWPNDLIEKLGACWGGEVAAEQYTKYLTPQTRTLYTTQPLGKLKAHLKLTADPDGDVELLDAFWLPEGAKPEGVLAPPIIVYADLLGIHDERTLETAEVLYEKHIAGRLQ